MAIFVSNDSNDDCVEASLVEFINHIWDQYWAGMKHYVVYITGAFNIQQGGGLEGSF